MTTIAVFITIGLILLRKHVGIGAEASIFGKEALRSGSSYFRVDPQQILSTLYKHGGFILPETLDHDLNIIRTVCRCETVWLDVVNRELEVLNFTVSVPEGRRQGDGIALRVGRLYVTWDSYIRPCIQLEVDDVEIIVEFLNFVLTSNNW